MKKQSGTDWKRLADMDDADIDTSDIEELDEEFFRNATLKVPAKKSITIRLDADVLAYYQSKGPGYQTRINQLLRQYMTVQESGESKSAS